MKFCVDCKYIQYSAFSSPFCIHESALVSISMVGGEKLYSSCSDMRIGEKKCSKDGKWFDPRPAPISDTRKIIMFIQKAFTS